MLSWFYLIYLINFVSGQVILKWGTWVDDWKADLSPLGRKGWYRGNYRTNGSYTYYATWGMAHNNGVIEGISREFISLNDGYCTIKFQLFFFCEVEGVFKGRGNAAWIDWIFLQKNTAQGSQIIRQIPAVESDNSSGKNEINGWKIWPHDKDTLEQNRCASGSYTSNYSNMNVWTKTFAINITTTKNGRFEISFVSHMNGFREYAATNNISFTCHWPTPPPTSSPTLNPTLNPTRKTKNPTKSPTLQPTNHPSQITVNPTALTQNPTDAPTFSPTKQTFNPSKNPTPYPSLLTNSPSQNTIIPSINPTLNPTTNPTTFPTNFPSKPPTLRPTRYGVKNKHKFHSIRDGIMKRIHKGDTYYFQGVVEKNGYLDIVNLFGAFIFLIYIPYYYIKYMSPFSYDEKLTKDHQIFILFKVLLTIPLFEIMGCMAMYFFGQEFVEWHLGFFAMFYLYYPYFMYFFVTFMIYYQFSNITNSISMGNERREQIHSDRQNAKKNGKIFLSFLLIYGLLSYSAGCIYLPSLWISLSWLFVLIILLAVISKNITTKIKKLKSQGAVPTLDGSTTDWKHLSNLQSIFTINIIVTILMIVLMAFSSYFLSKNGLFFDQKTMLPKYYIEIWRLCCILLSFFTLILTSQIYYSTHFEGIYKYSNNCCKTRNTKQLKESVTIHQTTKEVLDEDSGELNYNHSNKHSNNTFQRQKIFNGQINNEIEINDDEKESFMSIEESMDDYKQ